MPSDSNRRRAAASSHKIAFSMKVDLARLAIAGAKIAYEFAVDTLGDEYLADEGADSFRDIILEGFDALERFAIGDDVVTHGYTWPLGIRQQGRFASDLPASAHAIVLELEGEVLRVHFRLFDVYEGSYAIAPSGARFFEPGSIRIYYIDVATGLVMDEVFREKHR